MDLSRQRSRRPGGPNPPPCQGTQGRTRRSGCSSTPQVHAPVEITAHEWRSKSGAARPPSQTRHSSDTGPRNRLRGPVSRTAGPRHANTREGGRQRQRPDFRLTWGCVPTPSASPRAHATASPKWLGPSFVKRGTLGHHGAPHLSGRWRPVPQSPCSLPGGANGAHYHVGPASPGHPRGWVTDCWASRPAQRPGP